MKGMALKISDAKEWLEERGLPTCGDNRTLMNRMKDALLRMKANGERFH